MFTWTPPASSRGRPGRSISWVASGDAERNQVGNPPPHGQRAAGGRLHTDRDPDRRHPDVRRRRCDDAGVRCRGAHDGAGAAAGGCRAPGSGRDRPPRRAPVRGAGPDLRAAVLQRSQDPGYKVSGSNFAVRSDLSEALVLAPGPGATAKVEPGPEEFAVGTGGATIVGALHRYVTWRNESCPLLLCEGEQNTKRVIVAVTLDPDARKRRPGARVGLDHRGGPRHRAARVAGAARWRPGGGDPVTADSFYLYDTPCGQGTRQPQSGGHSTRDTASTGDNRGGQLHLRAPGPGPPAGPDGRLRAAGRHQHPRLRVLG